MDIHVAERRSGGYHFVFDAKHFAKSKLHRGEVRDVYDYKRRSRCSKAFILVPHYTEIYDSAVEEAEKLGIGIVELNYGASPLLAGIAFYDQTWPEIKTIIRQNDDPSWIRTIFKYLSGR
jgi:hypothetical protein